MANDFVQINGVRVSEQEAIIAYQEGKTVVVYKTGDKESDKGYSGRCFSLELGVHGEDLKAMLKEGSHPDAIYTVSTKRPTADQLTLFKTIEENYPNWIVARNKQEAADLYIKGCGESTYQEELEYLDIKQEPEKFFEAYEPDANLTIVVDEDGTKQTKTARAWIQVALDMDEGIPYWLAGAGE